MNRSCFIGRVGTTFDRTRQLTSQDPEGIEILNKRLIGLAAGTALFVLPHVAFADTLSPKVLQYNQQTISQPNGIVSQGTTYFPIWYVMQGLQKADIQSTWDGSNWHLTTTSGVTNVSNVHTGTGPVHVYLNGTLIQNMPSLIQKNTTYVPIWYLMQILQRINLYSTWNGTTWNVTTTSPGNASTPLAQAAFRSRSPETLGDQVVAYAKTLIGDPYRWGGTTPAGFDCSGYVQAVFAHFGKSLPRVSSSQAQVGPVISKSDLAPGDLVFFNTDGTPFSHVGIYAGNGQFISATTSSGVQLRNLNDPYYWGSRFTRAVNPF